MINARSWLAPQRAGVVITVLALLVVVLAAVLVFGALRDRGDGEAAERAKAPAAQPAVPEGTLHIELDEQARSGITVAAAAVAGGRDTVRAFATVLDPARLSELVNSAAAGRAQAAAARARLIASKAAADRAELLYRDDKTVSLAALQAAQAAYRADAASLSLASTQAEAFETTERQEFGPELSDHPALATALARRRVVLLQVTAPSGASSDAAATILVRNGAGTGVTARFVSSATRADPKLQGRSYFYVAPAQSWLLPGANLLAEMSGAARSGLLIPASAIVQWQGRSWFYTRTGKETFRRVMLAEDAPPANGGRLAKDLPPGAVIVVRGAELLLSQELRPTPQAAGDSD